ncbi:hypothetical protein OG243_37870 [Streptomyces sp. NBC_01318]|uniref:hypothetical protein n=1 Tax=Streptomyces sp. NBC_01318 TaxID=2903823 RepID=UPI002E13FF41|nr:hypothetical protein OG243_37870 [Streptomyces sp. NBC_01318]
MLEFPPCATKILSTVIELCPDHAVATQEEFVPGFGHGEAPQSRSEPVSARRRPAGPVSGQPLLIEQVHQEADD